MAVLAEPAYAVSTLGLRDIARFRGFRLVARYADMNSHVVRRKHCFNIFSTMKYAYNFNRLFGGQVEDKILAEMRNWPHP